MNAVIYFFVAFPTILRIFQIMASLCESLNMLKGFDA